jgi:hypothetical protein
LIVVALSPLLKKCGGDVKPFMTEVRRYFGGLAN